ncbi:MAG TPA: alginate lyase family protein, partial [Candidatus Eisenbacteria bacterium]|nr:alginate lyase family protein [Candidatus Eisenbacteria bacterium]
PLAAASRAASGPERERYAEAYLGAVASFASAHPGPYGIAWSSALELGLRVLSLVQGLPLVTQTEAFARAETSVLRILDRHARWLAADLSLDKVVRGNHLLGELSGLLAAGCLLPSARNEWWGECVVPSLLETEVLRQFHEDGVSVEQSLTYEKFVLEVLTTAAELARLRGEPLVPVVETRLALAAWHLEIVTTPDGTLPLVGDCDSGRGIADGEDPHRPARSIARARRVFRSDVPSSGLGRYHFERGGHVVLAPREGDFLFVRGGPFGWGRPGPAAHSHADWLAPVLNLDGEPILIDPGVFGYDVGSRLRNAFREWEAHNAIMPGAGRGPEPAGLFRWRGFDARADIALGEAWEVKGRVMWPHPPPLLWHRSIGYNQLHRGWRLEDRLEGAASGPVTCCMHLAPGIEVDAGKPGEFGLRLRSGKSFRLRLDPAVGTEIQKGWVAPAYGRREPSLVLTYILRPNQTGVVADIVLP